MSTINQNASTVCPHCGYTCSTKARLTSHLRHGHPTESLLEIRPLKVGPHPISSTRVTPSAAFATSASPGGLARVAPVKDVDEFANPKLELVSKSKRSIKDNNYWREEATSDRRTPDITKLSP